MLAVFGIGLTELIVLGVLGFGCAGGVGLIVLVVLLAGKGGRPRE